VTVSRVDNMATCWRSGTRGTCQCVEQSCVRVTSTSRTPTMSRSFTTDLRQTLGKVFLSELKVLLSKPQPTYCLCLYVINRYFIDKL